MFFFGIAKKKNQKKLRRLDAADYSAATVAAVAQRKSERKYADGNRFMLDNDLRRTAKIGV